MKKLRTSLKAMIIITAVTFIICLIGIAGTALIGEGTEYMAEIAVGFLGAASISLIGLWAFYGLALLKVKLIKWKTDTSKREMLLVNAAVIANGILGGAALVLFYNNMNFSVPEFFESILVVLYSFMFICSSAFGLLNIPFLGDTAVMILSLFIYSLIFAALMWVIYGIIVSIKKLKAKAEEIEKEEAAEK